MECNAIREGRYSTRNTAEQTGGLRHVDDPLFPGQIAALHRPFAANCPCTASCPSRKSHPTLKQLQLERSDETGILQIYEPEAKIVKTIFDLRIKGMNAVKIAEYLNKRGVSTPSSQIFTGNSDYNVISKWDGGAVRRIWRKKAYTGEFIDGKLASGKIDGKIKKVKNPESVISTIQIPAIITNKECHPPATKLLRNYSRGSSGHR
jgi:Recombinase